MRADELYVGGTAAMADLAATNGKPLRRLGMWNRCGTSRRRAPRAKLSPPAIKPPAGRPGGGICIDDGDRLRSIV